MPRGDKNIAANFKKLNFKELPKMTAPQVDQMHLDLYRVENFELYLRLKIAVAAEHTMTSVKNMDELQFQRGYARALMDMRTNMQAHVERLLKRNKK